MFDNDDGVFIVLRNEDEQYSLWPSEKEIPDGWTEVMPPSTKAACLAFVEENWTDMRPKRLRDAMNRES